MQRLGTETAFEVLGRARQLEAQGRSIVHLEIGEPDFDTPSHVVEAAVAAVRGGDTHYGPSAGVPELREAIAAHVARTRGVPVSADQVVVTPGAKPILFFAAMALLQDGDEVVYPDPGFPIYSSLIELAGATAVPLVLREDDAFGLDVDALRAALSPRTRMVILNSPHNPTGAVVGSARLQEIAQVLAARPDVWILSDEIYSGIIYDEAHASILSLPGFAPRTILVDGYSKAYAMTGWRLGYGVMPAALAAKVARLQTNVTSCTTSFVQRGGIAATQGSQQCVSDMVRAFRQRRDAIVLRLNAIPGMRCALPGGAFYAFPGVSGTGLQGPELARRLLEEAGIACLAGTAFGASGVDHLRFSYANSLENIEAGMDRVQAFVESL
jgi:aspartate/methionine/tyrosine aminotransferase